MLYTNSRAVAVVMAFLLRACGMSFAVVSMQTAVVEWNAAVVHGARDAAPGSPMVARALAVVHSCMFDAWAAYDAKAIGTHYGGSLRRPPPKRTLTNKQQAVSNAAYRALLDLLPIDKASVYAPLMQSIGDDPKDQSTDTSTPARIGNVVGAAVLAYRHRDSRTSPGAALTRERCGRTAGSGFLTGPPHFPLRTRTNQSISARAIPLSG